MLFRVAQFGLLKLSLIFCAGVGAGVAAMHWSPASERDASDAQNISAVSPHESYLIGRLSFLEASLARIDAFAQRMIDQHGLQGSEFDIATPIGIGGHDETLDKVLNRLSDGVRDSETRVALLTDWIHTQRRENEAKPNIWPIKRGWVSSAYGRRINPITRRREIHKGIDIVAREGAEVYAVASGVVIVSRKLDYYGNVVEIDHGNGYRTRYAHNKDNLVREGDTVRQGEVIALLGNTGRSTGPHLHFEVRKNGVAINPRKYLRSR